MLIHCPNCQTEQADENKVCTHCGAPLEGLNQKKGEPTKKEPEVWHGTPRPPVFSFAPLSSVETGTPAKPERAASPGTAAGTTAAGTTAAGTTAAGTTAAGTTAAGTTAAGTTAAGTTMATGGLLWKIPAALAILTAAALFLRADISQTSARTLPSPAAAPASAPAAPALASSPIEVPAPKPLPAVTGSDASGPDVLPSPPRSMPLILTLGSDGRNRTLIVGEPVTISAAATLSPGRSATLVMFYQHERGAKLLLAQAQGSLCRTVWTPTLAGNYKFTATALDDQRRVAAAPSLALRVNGLPTAPVKPVSVQPILVNPAPLKAVSAPPSAMRRTLKKPPAAKRAIPPHAPIVLPPIRFHVAAAAFPFERNAAVLANALHTRGFPAVVRKQKNSWGKTAYVVQTGVFPSAAEAHQQSLHLQRDGYPAYLYTSR